MHRHFDELTIRGVGARADRTAVEQPAAAHRAPGGNPRQRPRVANRSSRTSATPPVAASSVRSRRYPEPQPEPAQSRASGHAVIPGHAMIPGQGLDGPWPTAALHDTLPPFSRTTGAHEPAPLPPQRPSRFTLTGPPRTSASSMRQMLDHSSSNRAARQEGDGRVHASTGGGRTPRPTATPAAAESADADPEHTVRRRACARPGHVPPPACAGHGALVARSNLGHTSRGRRSCRAGGARMLEVQPWERRSSPPLPPGSGTAGFGWWRSAPGLCASPRQPRLILCLTTHPSP
jgi:hypothetical protein